MPNRTGKRQEVGRSRHAKDPGNAVNNESGREGSKDQELGACLEGGIVLT